MGKVKLIAYYLPQFAPNEFNDKWWGPGFTEWTNVSLSRPLFKGHIQPQIPGELGFYDLRLDETRIAQENLAASYGVDAFIYWNYWLGDGETLLGEALDLKLKTKKQSLPFCLAWANHDWKGVFFGSKSTLLKQRYLGVKDYKKYFFSLLEAFTDERYFKLNGNPVFYIYNPKAFNVSEFCSLWNDLLNRNTDYSRFHFICEGYSLDNSEADLFDHVAFSNHRKIASHKAYNFGSKYVNYIYWLLAKKRGLQVYHYKDAMKFFVEDDCDNDKHAPVIVPNWDTSPRLGKNAVILHGSNPELFEDHLEDLFKRIKNKNPERNIAFIKSWNEWAEGNYLEPSWKFQRGYLEKLRKVKRKYFD